jgi:hypothetical protein
MVEPKIAREDRLRFWREGRTLSSPRGSEQQVPAAMRDTSSHVPIFHFQKVLDIRDQLSECVARQNDRAQGTTGLLLDVVPVEFWTIAMLRYGKSMSMVRQRGSRKGH